MDLTEAACTKDGVDPEWFFSVDPSEIPDAPMRDVVNRSRKRHAQRVCATCPVRDACLDEHLLEPAGVFGGLDPKARQNLATAREMVRPPYLDHALVQRILAGQAVERTTGKAERLEAVRILLAQQVPVETIKKRLKVAWRYIDMARTG